jgi:hypothetical protein
LHNVSQALRVGVDQPDLGAQNCSRQRLSARFVGFDQHVWRAGIDIALFYKQRFKRPYTQVCIGQFRPSVVVVIVARVVRVAVMMMVVTPHALSPRFPRMLTQWVVPFRHGYGSGSPELFSEGVILLLPRCQNCIRDDGNYD